LAAVCIIAAGNRVGQFRRCLRSVLNHTAHERIELRCAFSDAAESLHYALGTLGPDGASPKWHQLPGRVERLRLTTKDGLRVWSWHTPACVGRADLLRLAFHDVSLEAEYVVCLDQGSCVEAGWWDALVPLMEQGIDYLGQPSWHDYRPGEADRLQMYPWYVGVPIARREGRWGTTFMRGECFAVRAQRLREVDFPPAGHSGDVETLLGAAAHQQGWSQQAFNQHLDWAAAVA
jgi:hypothetical protein